MTLPTFIAAWHLPTTTPLVLRLPPGVSPGAYLDALGPPLVLTVGAAVGTPVREWCKRQGVYCLSLVALGDDDARDRELVRIAAAVGRCVLVLYSGAAMEAARSAGLIVGEVEVSC